MRKEFYIAACAVLTVAGPVAAQDFLGGIARGMAQSAAQGLANRAVSAVTSPRTPAATPASGAPASRPAPTSRPGATASAPASNAAMPSPAPTNYRPGLKGPYELRFDPALQAEFRAFREFAKEPCRDCEGGFWFNDRVDLMVADLRPDRAVADRIGGMAIGEAIRWNARSGFPLAITVTGDIPMGDFPCKQVRWTATRGDRTAQYDGNVCYGKRGQYLAEPGWMRMGPN